VVGGIAGAILANAMFDLPLIAWSTTTRTGAAQLLTGQIRLGRNGEPVKVIPVGSVTAIAIDKGP
jgi:hypothetical protein